MTQFGQVMQFSSHRPIIHVLSFPSGGRIAKHVSAVYIFPYSAFSLPWTRFVQTENLKVCGGEMVVSVLAVQQVTRGNPQARGIPVSQTSRDSGWGVVWNFPWQYWAMCIYPLHISWMSIDMIFFNSSSRAFKAVTDQRVVSSTSGPADRLQEEGLLASKAQIRGKKDLSLLELARLEKSCHETGKPRRGELKHLKVLLLSSHLKWVEVTCCACVSRLRGGSQTQISVGTWTHKITRHHWNGWIRIFTSCVLALAEFLFFCKLISRYWSGTYSIAIIPGATGDYGHSVSWFFPGCRPFRRTSWARGLVLVKIQGWLKFENKDSYVHHISYFKCVFPGNRQNNFKIINLWPSWWPPFNCCLEMTPSSKFEPPRGPRLSGQRSGSRPGAGKKWFYQGKS